MSNRYVNFETPPKKSDKAIFHKTEINYIFFALKSHGMAQSSGKGALCRRDKTQL